ncbi:translation initiation factor IF-3 [Pseudomonadales bacterium]|nr:translation initiation factor IF-3 [Pseudomonadales bacterium]
MSSLFVRRFLSNEEVDATKRIMGPSVNLVNVETPIKKTSKRIDRSLLNDDIEAAEVRLVAADGSQRGVVPRAEALAEARQAGLDLVLVVADASPPVCKVMDYGKHLFELKKTKAAQRKKQKQIQVKEMKFRPGTEEGDYQVKLRNLKRFLEDGDKTKVSLRFRGREVVHPEIGMNLMTRIAADLDELGSVESEPKFEGRQVIMVLAPRKNKKAPSLKPDAE